MRRSTGENMRFQEMQSGTYTTKQKPHGVSFCMIRQNENMCGGRQKHTESPRNTHQTVQAHDHVLNRAHAREKLVDLTICREKAQVSYIHNT